MKHLKLMTTATFLFCLALLNFSCSSDDDSSSSEDLETFIRFTVDGTMYEFDDIASAASQNKSINGQNGLSEDEDYGFISIWFPLEMSTGTFDFTGDFFDEGDYKLRLESNPLNVDTEWATGGSVTLDSVDSDFITGTFTATLVNEDGETINLENGEFKAFGI